MSRLEEALRARHFHRLPSPEEFSVEIEGSNVPAVFHGAVKGWEAIARWNPSDGGLDYLLEKVGNAVVEAMLSKSAPVFYGDLRSHERIPIPFSAFITSCKFYQQEVGTSNRQEHMCTDSSYSKDEQALSEIPDLIYLAQVPILNAETKEICPLEILRGDIEMLFYGPLLHLLYYTQCLYLEKHQTIVDLVNPDFSVHGRAMNSKEYSQKIDLCSGDALFIPEGWFHQVDSHDLTIAVNFWWKSSVISNMLEHMDAYYLRRILNRLVDKEMNFMLISLEGCPESEEYFSKNDLLKGDFNRESNDQSGQNSKKFTLTSDQLEPHEVNVLYQLVSLVHSNLGTSSHDKSSDSTQKLSGINTEEDHKSAEATPSSIVLTNPVASILWSVEPQVLKKVLLSMVHQFPRTLEALVIHMLSPIAAEVLTKKFDKMDEETTKEQQSEFYGQFYSVFDDQYAAMDAILQGKESFSFQAFCNVMDKYLGVFVDENRTNLQMGKPSRSLPSLNPNH